MDTTNRKAAELTALVKKLQCEWADDPNIIRIGWGLSERNNKLESQTCLIFWVKEKIASDRVRTAKGTRMIPAEIEGIPTDVQVKNMKPLAGVGSRGDVIADPLNGGWNTSNADEHTIWFNGWGTLGLLCTDNSDGALMALSNWHVWADGADLGATIIQPAHPRTGEHVESVSKVLACGPLLTSLLEWESPDPIAAGLYGGAAAAAIAAALSDYKDPVRRGQEATPTATGEKTKSEQVTVSVEYLDLPIPGLPFKTDVKWEYQRTTSLTVHKNAVSEPQINAQFLLGKFVTSDKAHYLPGEEMKIYAALWDYQPRPCDAYYVVAHLIPDSRPEARFSVVLTPGICPKRLPVNPPTVSTGKLVCYDFGTHKQGEKYHYQHHFDWLACISLDKNDLIITDWLTSGSQSGKGELLIPIRGLRFSHNICGGVRVKTTRFSSAAIVLDAYDRSGNLLATTKSNLGQNQVDVLTVHAEGIASTLIRGGSGESVILEYCVEELEHSELSLTYSDEVFKRLEYAHVKTHLDQRKLRAKRCCYEGVFRVPPSEKAGRWTVYLTVQNINNVPQGTEPSVAAATIGGHLMTAPVAQVAACAFLMLGDHVFDIF